MNLDPAKTAQFWSKFTITDGCWEWRGRIGVGGYGTLSGVRAHRMAYMLAYGPIPEGLYVLHSCHNRRCVNPLHLRAGTAKDNAQDALDADRFSQGTRNGMSKLTPEAVAYIRSNPDGLRKAQLARTLGVSKATITGVLNGRVWRAA